jgi:uncharacterized surface protein with fasciclin (FAS1) repeats
MSLHRRIGTLALTSMLAVFALAACGGAPKDEATIDQPAADPAVAAQDEMASETPALQDIVGTAAAAGTFNTLAAALTAADLVVTLQGPGPFTVLAPTDEAFAKIPEADLQALLANKEELTKVLTYHVISGNVPASQVTTLTEASTVEGRKVTIAVVDGKVVLNGTSNVIATDVLASNGVIHVIDTVLMPPSM